MKKLIVLTVVPCFLFGCDDDQSENIRIGGTDIIENEIQKADENTLVVFDCDETLITMTDQILKFHHDTDLKKIELKMIITHPSLVSKIDELKSIVMLSANKSLVNKRLPDVVKNLQNRNIKTLMITSMKNEKFGEINSLIDWRIDELQKFGFDFSRSWKQLNPGYISKKGPYYSSGIICSKPTGKGKSLELFLKYAKIKPEKIIFVDDIKKNLLEVQKIANKLSIKFIGIECNEASQVSSGLKFSIPRAKFQIKYLAKNKVWISDEVAEKMIHTPN